MKQIAAALLGATLCQLQMAPAFSAGGPPLPQFDVESHCEQVACYGGSCSAVTKNGCYRIEQSAYDALKAGWADLPADIKKHCLAVARYGGSPAYTTLNGCARLEMRNAGRAETFRY